MSSRQIRRLATMRLVADATAGVPRGDMASDEDASDEGDHRPSFVSSSRKKKEKKTVTASPPSADGAAVVAHQPSPGVAQHVDPTSSAVASPPVTTSASTVPQKARQPPSDKASNTASGGAKRTAESATKKKASNASTKARGGGAGRRHGAGGAGKEEEDDEIDAVLASYAAAAAPNTAVTTPAHKVEAASYERLMVAPQVSRGHPSPFDPRSERMRCFGVGSVESLKPTHPELAPRFRDSWFASADPNKWPPFDPLGLKLESSYTVDARGKRGEYTVNATSREYIVASARLDAAVSSAHGSVQDMLDVWRQQPYHLPTLLSLHETFLVTGDLPIAQQMLDMALYTVGIVLAAFPLSGTPSDRTLRYGKSGDIGTAGNRLVYSILILGVHNALNKGCAATAHAIVKLIFSLDFGDPAGVLLLVEYTALRSCEWRWLVDVATALATDRSETLILPNLSFGAALAMFLLAERSATGTAAVEAKGRARTAAKGDSQTITHADATAALHDAVRTFPDVTVALATAVFGESTSAPGGDDAADGGTDASPERLHFIRPLARRAVPQSLAFHHIMSLFVERSAELWKSRNVGAFLRAAVEEMAAEEDSDTLETARQQREELQRDGQVTGHYGTVPKAVVLGGPRRAAVPRELLDQHMTAEEQAAEAARETEEQRARLDDDTRHALERFEALMGPLPDDLTIPERMQLYESMLHDEEQRLGQERHPLRLFLETLLPWNGLRDLALRAGLARQGLNDPVADAAAARRREAIRSLVAGEDSDDEATLQNDVAATRPQGRDLRRGPQRDDEDA